MMLVAMCNWFVPWDLQRCSGDKNVVTQSWGRLFRLFKPCIQETQHKMNFNIPYQASCFSASIIYSVFTVSSTRTSWLVLLVIKVLQVWQLESIPFSEGTQKAYTVIIDRICRSSSAVAWSTLSQWFCECAVLSCAVRIVLQLYTSS